MPSGSRCSKFCDSSRSVSSASPPSSAGSVSSRFSDTSRHTSRRRFPSSCGWAQRVRAALGRRWGGHTLTHRRQCRQLVPVQPQLTQVGQSPQSIRLQEQRGPRVTGRLSSPAGPGPTQRARPLRTSTSRSLPPRSSCSSLTRKDRDLHKKQRVSIQPRGPKPHGCTPNWQLVRRLCPLTPAVT